MLLYPILGEEQDLGEGKKSKSYHSYLFYYHVTIFTILLLESKIEGSSVTDVIGSA